MKKRFLAMTGAALMTAAPMMGQTGDRPRPIRVGAFEVYVLQESASTGNTGILIDAPAAVLAEYAPEGGYPSALNAVLVRRGDRVWLVDTAFGRKLFDQMAALGIGADDVDEVLLTHMHGDHIGGMLRDGVRMFPNATVSLSQKEFDYWSTAGNEAADGVFARYGDVMTTLSPVAIGDPVRQGITPIAAYGHTPGHTMFMIRDGGEQLLIWGDVAHAMAVQMPHPEISVRYDTDPAMARESRLAVLRHVAQSGIPVVGMHAPATAAGRISTEGSGYRFTVE